MNIRELEAAAGTKVRMIRYLISEGLVSQPDPDPTSGDKAKASYGPKHLAELRAFLYLQAAGLSHSQIRERMEQTPPAQMLEGLDETVHKLEPGFELKINASLLPADIDAGALVQRILGILAVLGHQKQTESTDHAEHADQD